MIQETIKTFLAPVFWEWPRAEIVPLFLNIISLCLDALFPTPFQLAHPFKIKAFFLYSSSASMTSSLLPKFLPTRLVSRFGNRSTKGINLEKTVDEEGPRLIPKGLNEDVMIFLRGHTHLTRVFNDGSKFNFVHFLSLTHPSPSPLCREFLLKPMALKFYSFYQRCWIRQNYQLIGVSFQFIHSKYTGPRTSSVYFVWWWVKDML